MSAAARPVIFLGQPLSGEERSAVLALAPDARLVEAADCSADTALAEAIEICWHLLPTGLWPRARSLRWLQASRAGVEWLSSTPGAAAHPVVVTNVHIHAGAVSQHLWAMCLALTRNLHAAIMQKERQVLDRSALVKGLATLEGRTACIVGLGTIGTRCARIAKALGMHVIGIRRRPQAGGLEPGTADEIAGPEGLLPALERARVVMVVVPGTPATRGMIGRREMAALQGAYLLNAGRGWCLDTDALVEALRDGRVRGAGLDVTDPEPLPAGHPLWTMPQVILTPHYAGDHPGYAREAFAVFLDNLGRYLRGEPLRNVVDKAAGY